MLSSQHWGSAVLNSVGLVSNSIALYCVNFVYENPYAEGFGGHFQYLTILGLTVATIACAIKLHRYFYPGSLKVLYEVVANIATPMEGLISILYWTMTFLEPTLLVPKDMPPIPAIIDCALHLYPAIFLWCDFLLFNIEFRRSHRHVAVIYAFAAFYLVWSWFCQTRNGYWPYPFLGNLQPLPRAFFYFFCGTLCWMIYEAGAVLHSRIHHRRRTISYIPAKKVN
ncbi:FAR-17a/AIG1-like protein [Dichotomocladium elegans]|nr:FAR-17a/AIG1-like protein [Dichotomocladium elegans]